jgi:endonuclease/exonuclease/phosphatase family metal-dependent hydrolase
MILSVVSFNIHKGFSSGRRRFVLQTVRALIRQTGADLVFLQEVLGEHRVHSKNLRFGPTQSQFEFLADEVWPHFAYGKNAVYSRGHHGNAILSRYPIQTWENIDISVHPSEKRGLLHAEILIPTLNAPLHCICTHFGLMETFRKTQAKGLCQRIRSHVPSEAPLLICGDFNDWKGTVSRILERELRLKDLFVQVTGREVKTFPSWLPILSLDRIFVRGFEAKLARRLSQKSWRRVSDHLALYADLEIPD